MQLWTGRLPTGLRALRRARRRNSLAKGDWADRLYQAYLAVIVIGTLTWFLASVAAGTEANAGQLRWIGAHGAAVVGLAAALAIASGIRSGSRGGPLNLELTTVHHELLAPLDRAAVLRKPATQQLSHLALAGAVTGGVAALVAGPSLPYDRAELLTGAIVAGTLVALTAVGAALVASGLRISRTLANLLGLALIGLALVDLLGLHIAAPTTSFGALALWELAGGPATLVAAALALASSVAGVVFVEGMSIEKARERAGLVEQLRFAMTMQDLRTVVLLRRHLAHEQLRVRPWVALPWSLRGGPRRRAVRGLLHFRTGRVLRMLVLGATAGLLLGWTADVPALLAPASATLFLAGYDAVEALGQEIDHRVLWSSHPMLNPGHLLTRLLEVGVLACLPVTVVAAVVASFVTGVDDGRVVPLAAIALLGAGGAATGAAVSTVLGPPDMATMASRYGSPDMIGWALVVRAVIPVVLTGMALLPVLALRRHGVDARIGSTAVSLVSPAAVAIALGWQWLRSRRPGTL